MSQGRPVEKIVHDGLVLGHQLIKLVHEHHAGDATWARVAKLPLQEVEGLGRAGSLALEGLPQERVRLVRVCDLHAVDLDKDEVVELVRANGLLEPGDDLAHRRRLARPRRARDVDAVARAVRDGGLEVRVHERELPLSAGEACGNRRDV